MNFNQNRHDSLFITKFDEKLRNRPEDSTKESDSLTALLARLKLLTEYGTGNTTDQEINNCSFDDVVIVLEDDYLGEDNIFEDKLKGSKTPQSCLCFKIGNYSLTMICTERKLKNNLAEFRSNYKIIRLFQIQNHLMTFCYVLISKLVPYWKTESIGGFISSVLHTRLIKHGEKSGLFLWVRLVYQTVAQRHWRSRAHVSLNI